MFRVLLFKLFFYGTILTEPPINNAINGDINPSMGITGKVLCNTMHKEKGVEIWNGMNFIS